MKTQRIVAPEQGRIEIEETELPALSAGRVLVENKYSAISPGTELAFLHHLPNTSGDFPCYLGYSAAGLVIDRHESVDSLEVGQRVVAFGPHAAQFVIEATGAPQAIPEAFALAARMGHVILLGSTRGETESVNFYRDVHKKGLVVIGAHDATRPKQDDHLYYCTHDADAQTVLKLLAAGRVSTDPLISDVVPYANAADAYQRLHARETGLMTIVLEW